MRPKQWTKNVLLFAGLFFAHKMLEPVAVERALAGFVIFCMLSGSIYLLNDVIDKPRDMLHPRKRRRPIASGALSTGLALRAALVIALLALFAALWISVYFGMCALAYLLMMTAYTFVLKEVFLIDTMIIAMGFTIRAVSGVIVLRSAHSSIPLTSWFVICVMFLSLFLAFCKRRGERVALDDEALAFRPVLGLYSLALMDAVIAITATGCILSYFLYTASMPDPWHMMTTFPFVLFGILRYLHLVYNREAGEAPESTLTADTQLLGCVLMWGVSLLLVYFRS